MSDAQHIDYENPLSPSEDFELMLKEGIDYIAQLSGNLWTDFNSHDPGITLLEQLCFVLTDLGYRTKDDLSVAFEHPRPGINKRLHNMGIFLPSEVLSFAPLTEHDYRKYILGHMSDRVRNCWFPKAANKGGYKGLYGAEIILSHDVRQHLGSEQTDNLQEVREEVMRHFHANRNLCESLDLADVMILEPLHLTFSADIEIEQGARGDVVLADILMALEGYVNPLVPITEVPKEQGSMAYNNAMPRNLHIEDRDLKPRTRRVAAPKVKELILQTPGVRSVKDSFRLLFGGHSGGSEVVSVEAHKYPTFADYFYGDIRRLPPLRITKDGVAYTFDFQKVREAILFREAQAIRRRESKDPGAKRLAADPDLPPRYQSIQYGLPSIYNVGKYGPMPDASEREKDNARKLRSFLMIFDVFLANQIKLLAEADLLFDASKREPTYRSARAEEMDLPSGEDEGQLPYEPKDQQVRRMDLERKARVIDHALARLGDHFDFDEQHLKSLQSSSTAFDLGPYAFLESQLSSKADFLKDYSRYSKWRYGGHDLLKTEDLRGNVAKFKLRFAAMLGIDNADDHSLTDHLEDPAQTEAPRPGGGRQRWREQSLPNGDKYVAVTGEGQPAASGVFTFPLKNATAIRNFYTLGVYFRNYEVVDMQNGSFTVIYRPPEGTLPVRVMEAQNQKEAIDGLTRLVHHLRRVAKRSEGFFCVEHILLQMEDSRDIKVVFKMGDLRLENVKYVDVSTQSEQVEKMMELGRHKDNIYIEKGPGGYLLQIGDNPMDPLFKTVQPISTKKDAERIKAQMVRAFVDELPNKDLTDYFFVLRDGTTPNWCNNRMTLIFPNWVSRFQSKAFDQMLDKLIHESIPAHIHVQVKKFNISMMRKFERSYFSWKSGKGSPAGLVNLLKAKDED